MIDIEGNQDTTQGARHNPFFGLSNILYGINFGVLAAFINVFFYVTYFADLSLFFGQTFVLICLITRGLNTAIITVLFASISAAICASDPYLIIVYCLELLIVHRMLIKGVSLFQSATLYWLLGGIPLLIILHALTTFDTPELLLVRGISIGINGLICLSLAALIFWLLPSRFTYSKYSANPPKLASLIFSLCMITVTLPTMVVASYFIWQTTHNNEQSTERWMKSLVEQAALSNNIEIERHLNGLITLAEIIETTNTPQLQALLNATAKNYDLFESLIITNKYGQIKNAAPHRYSMQLNKISNPSVQNREYFKLTKRTQKSRVSDALVGQGFGTEYLISVSVPVMLNGAFNGIIQGSIMLDTLSLHNQVNVMRNHLFVITDKQGRIIARSEELGYPLMSNFDFEDVKNPLISNIPVLKFNQDTFIYSQSNTATNWQITLLRSPAEITSMILEFFFLLILAACFLLLVFALMANRLSKKITKPLVDITRHFPKIDDKSKILKESQVSSEMVALTNKLIDSHEVMSNFQQQLSEQVHNKTKQLKQLNRELYSIAQKDSLTQLLNRAGFNRLAMASYRNCIRNKIPISVIFIDIDHFKIINDTYGHPFGDKCIIAAAKTIQHHCKRDTDVLGRYGGEEFIIMIAGGDVSEHKSRVSMIKDQIQGLTFKSGENRIKMTISAGICSLNNDFAIDYEDVLQKADEQLYLSKRGGRNKISSIIK